MWRAEGPCVTAISENEEREVGGGGGSLWWGEGGNPLESTNCGVRPPPRSTKKQSDLMRSDDLARGVTGDRRQAASAGDPAGQDKRGEERRGGTEGRSSRCTDGDRGGDGVVS